MSKERHKRSNVRVYPQFTPDQQSVLDEATTVVVEYETKKLNLLTALLQRFSYWTDQRQIAIARRDVDAEIDRQIPGQDSWAVENGDQPKDKDHVDWGNL